MKLNVEVSGNGYWWMGRDMILFAGQNRRNKKRKKDKEESWLEKGRWEEMSSMEEKEGEK